MKRDSSWTFGIITDGYHQERVSKIILSIIIQGIKTYEILIIGDKKLKYKNEFQSTHIKFLGYSKTGNWDLNKKIGGFNISQKKNLVIEKAKYENICFLHDYVVLDEKWYYGIKKFEENYKWDILTNKMVNFDGSRVFDWVMIDHPLFYNKVTYIPYDQTLNKYQYIPGNYWCGKKSVMKKYKLNENLKWGEQEDVEWSKRIRSKVKLSFNNYSMVKFVKLKEGPWLRGNMRYIKLILRSKIAYILFKLKVI